MEFASNPIYGVHRTHANATRTVFTELRQKALGLAAESSQNYRGHQKVSCTRGSLISTITREEEEEEILRNNGPQLCRHLEIHTSCQEKQRAESAISKVVTETN